jgi:hypothetical protein
MMSKEELMQLKHRYLGIAFNTISPRFKPKQVSQQSLNRYGQSFLSDETSKDSLMMVSKHEAF